MGLTEEVTFPSTYVEMEAAPQVYLVLCVICTKCIKSRHVGEVASVYIICENLLSEVNTKYQAYYILAHVDPV
jgi:hypothetical protein